MKDRHVRAKGMTYDTGLFENALAVQKAISGARNYIYIEDQFLWSRDVMDWIKSAVVANLDLKVIFLT